MVLGDARDRPVPAGESAVPFRCLATHSCLSEVKHAFRSAFVIFPALQMVIDLVVAIVLMAVGR